VVVELLLNGALADAIRSELSKSEESFIIPRLIDVEVLSAIRRLVAGKERGIAAGNFSKDWRRCRRSGVRTCRWLILSGNCI
jgi:hypothetical protein